MHEYGCVVDEDKDRGYPAAPGFVSGEDNVRKF